MQKTNEKVEGLFRAGCHFGYTKTRRHPSVSPFVFMTKNRVDIIDIEKSDEQLTKAVEIMKELVKAGKKILFVGIKPEAKNAILDIAHALEMPYVTERWIGGALTNFGEIKKRIARYLELKDKKEKGELDVYTKKERLLLDREMDKLEKNFGGLVNLTKIPDAMFVVDSKREIIAVEEALKARLPVFAIANTDCDITKITYPIVANDASVTSIAHIVEIIKSSLK